ncbi:MAG: pancreas/duodenum homeobox protein 1 [Desulfatitalea sp.]|nr:pancreas/duodenum homeobox protein 1 [Desulfatitalea sp.]
MNAHDFNNLFSEAQLDRIFPGDRADRFFDALLGDAEEGAYDIRLAFKSFTASQLHFDLELHQRPDKCLACNLTYGLPTVFARHPVIDVQGVVDRIDALLDGQGRCAGWRLDATREINRQLHVVPLVIDIER